MGTKGFLWSSGSAERSASVSRPVLRVRRSKLEMKNGKRGRGKEEVEVEVEEKEIESAHAAVKCYFLLQIHCSLFVCLPSVKPLSLLFAELGGKNGRCAVGGRLGARKEAFDLIEIHRNLRREPTVTSFFFFSTSTFSKEKKNVSLVSLLHSLFFYTLPSPSFPEEEHTQVLFSSPWRLALWPLFRQLLQRARKKK